MDCESDTLTAGEYNAQEGEATPELLPRAVAQRSTPVSFSIAGTKTQPLRIPQCIEIDDDEPGLTLPNAFSQFSNYV